MKCDAISGGGGYDPYSLLGKNETLSDFSDQIEPNSFFVNKKFLYDLKGNLIAPSVASHTQPKYTAIVGGSANKALEDSIFIGGGFDNLEADTRSAILGGIHNGEASTGQDYENLIAGGVFNHNQQYRSTILSGLNNVTTQKLSVILSGINNRTEDTGVIHGGLSNSILHISNSIITGYQNTITNGSDSLILNGSNNSTQYNYDFIGNGDSNQIIEVNAAQIPTANSAIYNGSRNIIKEKLCSIGNGEDNTIMSASSVIVNGKNNEIHSTLTAASNLIGTGDHNRIGFTTDPPFKEIIFSFIPMGSNNVVEDQLSFAGGKNMQLLGYSGGDVNIGEKGTYRTFLWGYKDDTNKVVIRSKADSSSSSAPKLDRAHDLFIIMSNVVGIGVDPNPPVGSGLPGVNPNIVAGERTRLLVDGNVHLASPGVLIIKNPNANLPTSAGTTKLGVDRGAKFIGTCTSCDLAEYFPSDKEVEAGDLLVMDNQDSLNVIKSYKPYDPNVIGIASAAPAITFEQSQLKAASGADQFTKGKNPPIALAGRVLTNVSLENGPIEIGDLLTSSSTPGCVMKATDPTKSFNSVVAKALEPFSGGEDGKAVGKITVMVVK